MRAVRQGRVFLCSDGKRDEACIRFRMSFHGLWIAYCICIARPCIAWEMCDHSMAVAMPPHHGTPPRLLDSCLIDR